MAKNPFYTGYIDQKLRKQDAPLFDSLTINATDTTILTSSSTGTKLVSDGLVLSPETNNTGRNKLTFLAANDTAMTGTFPTLFPTAGADVHYATGTGNRTYTTFGATTRAGFETATAVGSALYIRQSFRSDTTQSIDVYDANTYYIDATAASDYSKTLSWSLGKTGATTPYSLFSVRGRTQATSSVTDPNGTSYVVGAYASAATRLNKIHLSTPYEDNNSSQGLVIAYNAGNASITYHSQAIATGESYIGFDSAAFTPALRMTATEIQFYTPAIGVDPTDSTHLVTKNYADVNNESLYRFMNAHGSTVESFTAQPVGETPLELSTYSMASGNRDEIAYYSTVSKKYIYTNGGSSTQIVTILDVTNPRYPIGTSYDVGSTNINALSATSSSGAVLYIGINNTLYYYSIATPTAPTVIGNTGSVGSTINTLIIDGSYLYMGAGSTVRIYNITTPSAPSLTGSISALATINDIKISGNALYAAIGTSGVQVFDVTNKSIPQNYGGGEATLFDDGGTYTRLSVGLIEDTTYLFVAATTGGIHIYDTTDPGALSLVITTQSTNGDEYIISYFGGSDKYYIAVGSSTSPALDLIDVTTPSTPSIKSTISTSAIISSLYISGTTLYAIDSTTGATVYNIGTRLMTDKIKINSLDDDALLVTGGATIEKNVQIDGVMIDHVRVVTKEPTGFSDRSDSILSFVEGTRTVSIAPAVTSFEVYATGQLFIFTTTQSVVIPNTSGVHKTYIDTSGVFQVGSSVPEGTCHVADVVWDASNGKVVFYIDERHGMIMDHATGEAFETINGYVVKSGLALNNLSVDQDGSLLTHAQFGVDDGVLWQKETELDITNGLPETLAPTLTCDVLYRIGTIWNALHASDRDAIISGSGAVPVKIGAAGQRIQYNQYLGGSWSMVQATEGYYVNHYVFAKPSPLNPIVVFIGTGEYATWQLASVNCPEELNDMIPNIPVYHELALIGTIVYQTSSAYTNVVKCRIVSICHDHEWHDYRSTKRNSDRAAHYHHLLEGRNHDDHTQYALLEGRTADILKIDDIQPLDSTKITVTGDFHVTGALTSAVTAETGEPTGFPNQTDTTISFISGTRTLTITPVSSSFAVYIKGNRYVKTTAESVVISTTEGLQWTYYDINGVLSTALSGGVNVMAVATICLIYWDATNAVAIIFADERHGITMDGATHSYLHNAFGTKWASGLALSGFTLGNGSLNSHAQYTVGTGRILDEDLTHNIPASTGQVLSPLTAPVFYHSGPVSSAVWRRQVASSIPVITAGTGRLAYNQNDGANWVLTEVSNNNYVCYHVFATGDELYPMIVIAGQSVQTTLATARTTAAEEIAAIVSTGLPIIEFVPVATVIYQTSSSYSNSVKAKIVEYEAGGSVWADFRTSKLNATVGAGDHGVLTGLTDDDHAQYMFLNGRSGGQTLIGGIEVSDNLTIQSTSSITKGKIIIDENIDIAVTTGRTLNFGTAAAVQTITMGSTNTTSAVTIRSGSGNTTFTIGGNISIKNGSDSIVSTIGSDGSYAGISFDAYAATALILGQITATYISVGAITKYLKIEDSTDATDTTDGGLRVAGGASIVKKLFVGTSMQSPILDALAAGALSIGSTIASSVTMGRNGITSAIDGSTINVGTASESKTVNVGTAATDAQVVNLGSNTGASELNMYAGTGGATMKLSTLTSASAFSITKSNDSVLLSATGAGLVTLNSFAGNTLTFTDTDVTDESVANAVVVYIQAASVNIAVNSFTGGVSGQVLYLVDDSSAAYTVTIVHNSGSGTGQKFLTPHGADITIGTGVAKTVYVAVCNGTNWMVTGDIGSVDTLKIYSATDNTLGNTATGALQVVGGLGLAKNLSVGQSAQITTALLVPRMDTATGVPLLIGNTTATQVDVSRAGATTNVYGSTITMTGVVNIPTGSSITWVDDPSASNHLVNKAYADALASGLKFKTSVRAKTSQAWTNVPTPSGTGVGKTLTASVSEAIADRAADFDGVSLLIGERVLIDNVAYGAASAHAGIYTVTDVGSGATPWVLTRATDLDSDAEGLNGTYTYVSEGTTYSGQRWIAITGAAFTIDTDTMSWSVYSSDAFAAGTGIVLVGNTISIDQTFSPTWSGSHIFSNAITANGGIVATSVTSPSIDTSGAATFTVGGTNSNAITLGRVGAAVSIADSTAATNSTTGALKVVGGISTQAALWFGTELNGVNTTEFSQLATIGSAVISEAQWGYLGAFDQGLATTSAVTFTSVGGKVNATSLSGTRATVNGSTTMNAYDVASKTIIELNTGAGTAGNIVVNTFTNGVAGQLLILVDVATSAHTITLTHNSAETGEKILTPSEQDIVIESTIKYGSIILVRDASAWRVVGMTDQAGAFKVHSSTDNTLGNAATGALQVVGGAGFGGNLTVGGSIDTDGVSRAVGDLSFSTTDGNIIIDPEGSKDMIVKLSDAAGARKLIIQASTNAEIASINSVGLGTFNAGVYTNAIENVVSSAMAVGTSINTTSVLMGGANTTEIKLRAPIWSGPVGDLAVYFTTKLTAAAVTIKSREAAVDGYIQVLDDSDATSTATGAFRVDGGISTVKNIYGGTNVYAVTALNSPSHQTIGTTDMTISTSGVSNVSIGHSTKTSTVTGSTITLSTADLDFGVGGGKTVEIATGTTDTLGTIKILDTTASSNATTGSLVLGGGLGLAGAINAGGALTVGGDISLGNNDIVNGTGTMGGISAAIRTELANIGTETISATQWGYVGALDQSLTTTGTPTFSSVSVSAAPTTNAHLANKEYVDALASGIKFKSAVRAKTSQAWTNVPTPSGSGVGKTLTASVNGAISTVAADFDDITLLATERVLVDDDAYGGANLSNGIYTVTDVGSVSTPWVLTRATDADGSPVGELQTGVLVYIQEGTLYGGSRHIAILPDPFTIDTTALSWTIYATDVATAGNGISMTGGSIAVNQGYAFSWTAEHTFGIGLKSDTIAEETLAAGVTIDGVLLKDNGVTASGTIDFSGATIGIGSSTSVTAINIGTNATGAKTLSIGSTATGSGILMTASTAHLVAKLNAADATIQFQIKNSSNAITSYIAANGSALFSAITGPAGGFTITGGSGAGDDLTLLSTSHATRGTIIIDDAVDVAVGTTARTINIGTGAAAHAVTIGSTNTTASLALNAGTGNMTLTSAGIITVVGGASNDVIIKLGDAAGARKVAIQDSATAEVASINSDGGIVGTSLSLGAVTDASGSAAAFTNMTAPTFTMVSYQRVANVVTVALDITFQVTGSVTTTSFKVTDATLPISGKNFVTTSLVSAGASNYLAYVKAGIDSATLTFTISGMSFVASTDYTLQCVSTYLV